MAIWTQTENRPLVEAYMEMLGLQAAGSDYSKTEYRRRVMAQTPNRSKGSIEFKFQNVSAVLEDAGLEWIEGYKPRHHGQKQALRAEVQAYLDRAKPHFIVVSPDSLT